VRDFLVNFFGALMSVVGIKSKREKKTIRKLTKLSRGEKITKFALEDTKSHLEIFNDYKIFFI
jgi:hypothetical protein